MRARIYDAAILPLTIRWYRAVLERIEPGGRLLDIGVGTAGALCANADMVRNLDLHVLGVDIDAHYVERATSRVIESGLQDRVEIRLQSIYDCHDAPFDAVYFSASFMLLPDPVAALQQVMGQLTPDGRVFFTQTFQDRRSRLMERAKPLLKKITTIDFGTVTYEADFRSTVEGAGLEILDMVTLGGHGNRSYRMIVGRPKDPSARG
ncbi:MAG: class I SAM-dependent methyltransferase [Myxococcales bacterium]|nr:class I SAM-dependent methyltransferase [Myxococcales bacterium]MCB9692231.1 class I SAM-dependent methyltransferase [Alphaproteobacteria bacterium]